MKRAFHILIFVIFSIALHAEEHGRFVNTPYTAQNVVFDFYFDEPEKINSGLFWIRSLLNPLMEEPYGLAPEEVNIKVVIHGTEIVTLVKKNNKKYKEAVQRMQYYAGFGVEFKVCGLVMDEYGYSVKDFYEFVEIVPSAITELVHWQMKGYGLITPQVRLKKHDIKDIR
ncbi:MAG: DsrE family protein [Gammaproteobacteria bacterium]|nr:DsrE family protein [Gammaproteobacteria bacterium]